MHFSTSVGFLKLIKKEYLEIKKNIFATEIWLKWIPFFPWEILLRPYARLIFLSSQFLLNFKVIIATLIFESS